MFIYLYWANGLILQQFDRHFLHSRSSKKRWFRWKKCQTLFILFEIKIFRYKFVFPLIKKFLWEIDKLDVKRKETSKKNMKWLKNNLSEINCQSVFNTQVHVFFCFVSFLWKKNIILYKWRVRIQMVGLSQKISSYVYVT